MLDNSQHLTDSGGYASVAAITAAPVKAEPPPPKKTTTTTGIVLKPETPTVDLTGEVGSALTYLGGVEISPENALGLESTCISWSRSGFGVDVNFKMTPEGPQADLTLSYESSETFGKGKDAETITAAGHVTLTYNENEAAEPGPSDSYAALEAIGTGTASTSGSAATAAADFAGGAAGIVAYNNLAAHGFDSIAAGDVAGEAAAGGLADIVPLFEDSPVEGVEALAEFGAAIGF